MTEHEKAMFRRKGHRNEIILHTKGDMSDDFTLTFKITKEFRDPGYLFSTSAEKRIIRK